VESRALVQLFGRNVRHFREERGWSQERLAQAADLDRSYISDIERGARNPTLVIVARLAGALGLDPASLLAATGSPDVP
jgi:XRE family transcriptional regulator, regulator of sulfur utilization